MPALPRFLLPLVAALVILVQAAASFAAIEVSGGPSCCCPDPELCECFDHEGEHDDAPQLRRCTQDAVQAAVPLLLPAVLPPPAPTLIAPRPSAAPPAPVPALPDRDPDRPEKPPS